MIFIRKYENVIDVGGGGRCGRFFEVSETCEFMFLPPDRICELLSDDRIVVEHEMDVFCAFLRWVDHDRQNRICHAAHLLQDAVRLHCINPECIVCNIETVDWLFDAVPECQVVTNEAMRSRPLICLLFKFSVRVGHETASISAKFIGFNVPLNKSFRGPA